MDVLSREFCIHRGTKQSDPLSSLLFNSVSEGIFRQLQPQWAKRQCEIHLRPGASAGSILTNLRFADDVLLFATSLQQLKTMLKEIQQEALRVGLELHPDKTKILHNIQRRKPTQQPETTRINDMNVEILGYGASQKYLGRQLAFRTPTETELSNRTSTAWHKIY